VFVRDRASGTTERVSVATGGAQAGWGGFGPSISADGRYVAFVSLSPDLTPSGRTGIFVRDRRAGTTEWVGGSYYLSDLVSPALAISADGRSVAFSQAYENLGSHTIPRSDVYVRDRRTGALEQVIVSPGGPHNNGRVAGLAISADGRFVAVSTDTPDLVPGDTNGTYDVFVRDRARRTTERVSVATGGAQTDGGSFDPALSANGRHVAFSSDADNLVPGDTNGATDVFVRAR